MTVSPPTDFPAADGYQAVEPGLMFSLSPMMMLGLLLLLVLAAALGWMMARRQAPTDDPSEGIYDAIKKAIGTASGAPRDQVVATARKLKSTIDARLGAVLTLADGLGGPCATLDQALRGLGSDHGTTGSHDPEPQPVPTFVIHAKRDVTIHAVEPTPPETAHGHGPHDHAPADPHGSHSGDHDAHAKPVDAATQIANIRAAVHALSDHWTDRPARLKDLRAARSQLMSPVSGTGDRVWNRS
ncbi:hypothetical protein BH10PSE2_BH10PSE2_13580 [soil metagenome]